MENETTTTTTAQPAEGTTGGDDTELVTISRRDFDAQLAAARRSGQGRAPGAAPEAARQPSRLDRLESSIEKLVGALTPQPPAQQQTTITPPPAAPNAPAKVERDGIHGVAGITNPWSLTPEQIDDLGPEGCRQILDELVQRGRSRLGMPPTPKVPGQRQGEQLLAALQRGGGNGGRR